MLAAFAGNEPLALSTLAGELASPADGLSAFARFLLGRLFVVIAKLHFTEDAFALHLLLQRFQRLVDVVVPDDDLHVPSILSVPRARSTQARTNRPGLTDNKYA